MTDKNPNPFEAPQMLADMDGSAGASSAERVIVPFRPADTISRIAIVLIVVCLIANLLCIAATLSQISLLGSVAGGAVIGIDEAEANDGRYVAANLVALLTIAASGIAFLSWFHRVHSNLPVLAAQSIRFTPGWAVGYFFIPFVNLVRPYQVADEIWKGSDPGRVDGSGIAPASPSIVGWWWAAYILSSLANSVVSRLAVGTERISELIYLSWVEVGATVVLIAAGILLVLVIRNVTKNQSTRYELLQTPQGAQHMRNYGGSEAVTPAAPTIEEMYAEALLYGAELVADRVTYQADWNAAMIREHGEWVEPQLTEIYELAKQIGKQPKDNWNELIVQATRA